MDFLTIESGKTGKDVNILVVTDHITWYAQTFVTPSQATWVVAQTLWDKFFMHCGIPEKILSDEGHNLESTVIAELCELSKIKKLQTTWYRPQCNGQCEHFNVTLISMIGTLPTEAKINWQEQLSTYVHAYNCSHSMLPIDEQFGVRTPDTIASTSHGYIQKLQRRLDWAYETANEVN